MLKTVVFSDKKYTFPSLNLPLYETLLEPIKNTAGNILEIGVHSGGSIKLWYDYFTKATIYGCDIKNSVKIHELKTNNRIFLNLCHAK